MTPTQLAIFALLLGLIVGAAVTTVLVLALRARDRYRRETDGELPDGIAAVVAGMDDAPDPYLQQFIHGRAEGPIAAVR